jgi:hypothetical protein
VSRGQGNNRQHRDRVVEIVIADDENVPLPGLPRTFDRV